MDPFKEINVWTNTCVKKPKKENYGATLKGKKIECNIWKKIKRKARKEFQIRPEPG